MIFLPFAEEPTPKEKGYTYTLVLKEVTEVKCKVHALPIPSFRWFVLTDSGDRKELTSLEPVTQEEDSLWVVSTLRQTFEVSDLGSDCTVELVCEAENELGTSIQTFKLSPSDPSDCQPPSGGEASTSDPLAREKSATTKAFPARQVSDGELPIKPKIMVILSVFLLGGFL